MAIFNIQCVRRFMTVAVAIIDVLNTYDILVLKGDTQPYNQYMRNFLTENPFKINV